MNEHKKTAAFEFTVKEMSGMKTVTYLFIVVVSICVSLLSLSACQNDLFQPTVNGSSTLLPTSVTVMRLTAPITTPAVRTILPDSSSTPMFATPFATTAASPPTTGPEEAPITSVSDVLTGPLLAVHGIPPYFPADTMYLVDLGQGVARELRFEEGNPVWSEWTDQGCSLYVWLALTAPSDTVEILVTDLYGSRIRSVYKFHPSSLLEAYPRREDVVGDGGYWLSPVEDYLAYQVMYNNWDYDVEVVATDGNSAPVQLTQRQGGTQIAWSPDGQQLVFTDYDEAGIRQLFVASPTTWQRRQLTWYQEGGQYIDYSPGGVLFSEFVWSPDGQSVAFVRSLSVSESDFSTSLWVVPVSGGETVEIALEPGIASGSVIAWSADSSRLAIETERMTPGDRGSESIYWFDVATRTPYHVLDSADVPSATIAWAFPVDNIKTIGFGNGLQELYFYDVETMEFTEAVIPELPPSPGFSAVPSPSTFDGEAACHSD